MFPIYCNYDSHMFFQKLVDKKNDKVEFDIIPKMNEEYISVTHGCFRFIDSYRFLPMKLDGLVKKLNDDEFKILKKEFPDKQQFLKKKLSYTDE